MSQNYLIKKRFPGTLLASTQLVKTVLVLILVLISIPTARAQETLSLADALHPHVKTLKRSIHTYHYATREGVKVPIEGKLDENNPKLANHVQDWANYYW